MIEGRFVELCWNDIEAMLCERFKCDKDDIHYPYASRFAQPESMGGTIIEIRVEEGRG
jgi:hypothetical protein